jgi:hypothetical protein
MVPVKLSVIYTIIEQNNFGRADLLYSVDSSARIYKNERENEAICFTSVTFNYKMILLANMDLRIIHFWEGVRKSH